MPRIQEQWSDPDSRDNLIEGIARWLSKTGDLDQYEEELDELASFLKPDEVCALYERLTNERLEFEWRDQFIGHFPQSESYLPGIGITEEEFDASVESGSATPLDYEEAQPALSQQRRSARRKWWQFWSAK
jgi:hypothetical protein